MNFDEMTSYDLALYAEEAGAAGDADGEAEARDVLVDRGYRRDIDAWTIEQAGPNGDPRCI